MPIDINLFRADRGGDPDLIRESQRRRFASVELVDEIIALDNEWRRMTGDIDFMKKDRNAVQKEVAQKKKAKEECDDLVLRIKQIGENITATEQAQAATKKEIDSKVRLVGNIVDMSVKVSQDEDNDNEVVSTWGTPRDPQGLLNHHDLLWRIGGYEPERGVAVAGHRGYFLKDMGVLLNQAFINYGIAFLRKKGYSILQPPYMMKKSVMAGVAQLEQFDEELYNVSNGTTEESYLIATSEQPICGFHMGEWIEEKSLPIKYSGVSTCFRKEAGSHGKDTWGIFRVHQFEKVEQFVIVEGDIEASRKMQEEMSKVAEEFYQSLGFPYRVINIVTGALNNAAIKKLDLECWFPGYNAYRELVSCSNCTDYQSRSMEIRCGIKKLGDREKKYVHMLNSTLCATGRAICCLLETYQTPDGVRVPDVLVPFMGGITFMPFIRGARGGEGSQYDTASKSKSANTQKSKPTEKLPTPPASAAPTGPGADIAASIVSVGNEVRDLKASKADKAVIKSKVDELLALKSKYQEVTGSAYVAPGQQPAKAAKEDKSKTNPPPAPSPSTSIQTGPGADIAASIVSVGNEVRDLKASKADKAVIKSKVDELLALKSKYQEVTGSAYVAPGQQPAKAAKEDKSKTNPPPAPSPSTSIQTGPGADIAASIVSVGNEVRDLKASKADKAVIKSKVDELLALKSKYQEVTGSAYVAPGQQPAKAAKEGKSKTSEQQASKAKAEKPLQNAKKSEAPSAAKPTPQVVKKTPPPNSVWADGNVDFGLLEARLKVFSYVGGYAPSTEDNKVFDAVQGKSDVDGVSTKRWLRNMRSFSATERAAW